MFLGHVGPKSMLMSMMLLPVNPNHRDWLTQWRRGGAGESGIPAVCRGMRRKPLRRAHSDALGVHEWPSISKEPKTRVYLVE